MGAPARIVKSAVDVIPKVEAYAPYVAARETLLAREQVFAKLVAQERQAQAHARAQGTQVLRRADVAARAAADAEAGRLIASGSELSIPSAWDAETAREAQRLMIPHLVAARADCDAAKAQYSAEMLERYRDEIARCRQRRTDAISEVAAANDSINELIGRLRAAGVIVWLDQVLRP